MTTWLILALAFTAFIAAPREGSLFQEKAEAYGYWRAVAIALLWGGTFAAPVAGVILVVRAWAGWVVRR